MTTNETQTRDRQTTRIAPRTGVAFPLPKGATLTVIDPEGTQVSDLLAFAADDVREVISNGRTFDYEETIALTTGNRLWSNRSRVLLTIEEDTVGRHDFLLTPCSKDTFHHFYPDKPVHRGCFHDAVRAQPGDTGGAYRARNPALVGYRASQPPLRRLRRPGAAARGAHDRRSGQDGPAPRRLRVRSLPD